VLSVGVGTGSIAVAFVGAAVLVLWAFLTGGPRTRRLASVAGIAGVVGVAASVFVFMMLRARLDPAINQGNPATPGGVLDVMARRQYDVPGLWPRRAPLWLQVGNLFQYADWQFALGLDRAVGPSWLRTPFTPVFVVLGLVGSAWHRRRDRRTWAAMVILFASATLGVVVYLNLKAGPSFGYGVLPPGADHEARERDYFFALGFAAFGLWAGQGAVVLARRLARKAERPSLAWLGLAVAVLPIALNWRAVDRRRQPAASLPNAFARATLESAPPRAVLFVAGDNDTYPLWYAQVAGNVRRDVSIVTVPLLPAAWYRGELARRFDLYDAADTAGWRGLRGEMAAIAGHAGRSNRPVVVSVGIEPSLREGLGPSWVFRGLVYVRTPLEHASASTSIDVGGVDSTAATIRRLFVGPVDPRRVDDPAGAYLTSLLMCPALASQATQRTLADTIGLLASRCNFR